MPPARNKNKVLGQKPPLTLSEVRNIRRMLKEKQAHRDLALFNLAIDSKLIPDDLVQLRRRDVTQDNRILSRAVVVVKRTQRPVEFEISDETRAALIKWINIQEILDDGFLFPSRSRRNLPLSVRQFARVLDGWLSEVGLDPALYGAHSLRRTKAIMIYEQTGDLAAVKKLLGHAKMSSTVRYLGIGAKGPIDAVAIAQKIKI